MNKYNNKDLEVLATVLNSIKTFYIRVPFGIRILQVLLLGFVNYYWWIYAIQLILILDIFILVFIAPVKSFRWLIFYYQDSIYQMNQYKYKQQNIDPPTPPTNANTQFLAINQKNYIGRVGDKKTVNNNKILNNTLIYNRVPIPTITNAYLGSNDEEKKVRLKLDKHTAELDLKEVYSIREIKRFASTYAGKYNDTGNPIHSDKALFYQKLLKAANERIKLETRTLKQPDFFDKSAK